ncbi:hypothetical protein [Hathewaya limosa]|uniref:2'-5' RNA ligase n=1 Tax=Hathewaya limosa TaxID=1536 RepID=A0ABU0JRX0_HATLI|nr:hypothetical protein [Hathewaya limosa]AWZ49691.1 hypothetical protein C3495_13185 [Clostridiaceae bacterium 14S0207]MDQ0478677.1 hypothetical protein [Hathewaya limosa]
MKYQLVALFDEESHNRIESIQKQVCRRYRLYKSNPSIYIPLSTMVNPNLEKLDMVVSKILNPYKKFKVEITNSIYVNNDHKQVGLIIDEKGYISRISRNILEILSLHGFNLNSMTCENLSSSLKIPMANTNYNVKKASSQSLLTVNKNLLPADYLSVAKINRIELWKLNGNKKDCVIKSFPLKNF